MTQKQTDALEKIIAALPEESRPIFREVAEYAISLGYMPKIMGVRGDYADFSKSKIKRTVLKIGTDPKFPPRLALKFYALSKFTTTFREAVEERLKVWQRLGYEAKCFGCGRCDGTEGYTAVFPDGTEGFLCGYGVLDVPAFSAENVDEIKAAIKIQDEFFMGQILKK